MGCLKLSYRPQLTLVKNDKRVLDMEKPFINQYRFGFNGEEKDDEVSGDGNSTNFGDRTYDSRIGRWASGDPEMRNYPNFSPYSAFANNPNYFTDEDGRVLKDKQGRIIFTIAPSRDNMMNLPRRLAEGKEITHSVNYVAVDIYSNNGEPIRVYIQAAVIDLKTGEDVRDQVSQFFTNCHGVSMLMGLLNARDKDGANALIRDKIGIAATKNINDHLSTDYSKIKTGDVLVYLDGAGNAIHSAVWDEEKKMYLTKNGDGAITYMTKEEIDNVYKTDYKTVGFFTPQADKQIEIKDSPGPINNTNMADSPAAVKRSLAKQLKKDQKAAKKAAKNKNNSN